jgi:hypothetical protein
MPSTAQPLPSFPRRARLLALMAIAALVASCGGTRFMSSSDHRLGAPPAGRVLVNFHRPSNWGGGQDFPVYDRFALIGNLKGGSEFQLVCDPGDHFFIGRADHVSCVRAHLAADRVYDIVVDVTPGAWQENIFLSPVHKDGRRQYKLGEFEDREEVFVLTDLDDARNFSAKHHDDIAEILADFDGGPKSERVRSLNADDCR